MSVMKKWFMGGTLVLLGFVVNPVQAQWGSRAGMYSEDGVQVGVDQRVFSVLTMLNQHGFDEDPYLGPEPIKTPQMSETRQRVRGLMRRKGPVQKSFGKFIEKNAQAFPWYIASSLKVGKGPSFETTMKDEKVVRSMGTMMHDWFHEEGGSGFYDIAVKMNKNQQVEIVDVINTQTAALQNTLVVGDSEDALLEEELNPMGRVVVVIAPMAPHDYLARFDVEDVTFVVTGPWKKEGHINEIAEVVSVAYGRTIIAAQVALQEDGLKRYQKIFDKWSGDADLRPADVASLVSEMMACAAHQITHEKETCRFSPALADEKGSKAVGKMKAKLTKLAVEGAVFSAILPNLLKK